MMDEKAYEAAEATTERYKQLAIEEGRGLKKYTILVLGSEYEEHPLVLEAKDADDRTRKMRASGIDPNGDHWAAAQHKGREGYSICGNDGAAKTALQAYLRKR